MSMEDSVLLTSTNLIPLIKHDGKLYQLIESYNKVAKVFTLTCNIICRGKKDIEAFHFSVDNKGIFKINVSIEDRVRKELFKHWFTYGVTDFALLRDWANYVNRNLASPHSLVVLILYRDYCNTDTSNNSEFRRDKMTKLTGDDMVSAYLKAAKLLDKSIVNRKFPAHIKALLALSSAKETDTKIISDSDKLAQNIYSEIRKHKNFLTLPKVGLAALLRGVDKVKTGLDLLSGEEITPIVETPVKKQTKVIKEKKQLTLDKVELSHENQPNIKPLLNVQAQAKRLGIGQRNSLRSYIPKKTALSHEVITDNSKVVLSDVNFNKGKQFNDAQPYDQRRASMYNKFNRSVAVQQIGDLAKLNALLWCKVSVHFYMRLNIIGVKFPNIARIEVSEKPYDSYSWVEIGLLRSGKERKLYCCVHKSLLVSKAYSIDLITIGLAKLGMLANSVVCPSHVRKPNKYRQTEFWQAVVQRELGIGLSFEPKNPTVPYTVEHCINW
jgi:hypothetical protein